MNKFMHVDVCEFLKCMVAVNTERYRSDFTYDMKRFYNALRDKDETQRYFIWYSRSSGVECECIYDILDTEWTAKCFYYNEYERDESRGFLTFVVKLEELKGASVIGSLVKVDFHSFCNELKKHRFSPDYYDVKYVQDGKMKEDCFAPSRLKDFIRYNPDVKIAYKAKTHDERVEYSISWMRSEMHSYFNVNPNDNIMDFKYSTEEHTGYVKTLCLTVRDTDRKNKKFFYAYHSDYCVNEDMALNNINQAVKEYLYSDIGKERYGVIPELREKWELPKNMDWVDVLRSMPEKFLLKYGIQTSIEHFEKRWRA